MKLSVPKDAEDSMYRIDGFYFTARYPGDNSFHPGEQDVEAAKEAVEQARAYTYSVINYLHREGAQQWDMNEVITEDRQYGTEEPDLM